MKSVSINRQVGSIFFIVGIEVGGGILALPILISQMGFISGCILMFIAWLLMTYTALLSCEINLALEDNVSFAGMAKQLLNIPLQIILWLSFLLLLYTIIVAYISAAGSAFENILNLKQNIISLIFVAILGMFVVLGTSAVDLINRILLCLKLILLLFVCITLVPSIHFNNLNHSSIKLPLIISAIPIFTTTFTSHLIIPSIRTYLDSNAKVIARVFIIGSLIPLILYFIWVMGILGVIPTSGINSFGLISAKGNSANIGDILFLIKANLPNSHLYSPIVLFSNISVSTSFLGVSLALFHFIIDAFKLRRLTPIKRNVIATLLTFILPLIIVWIYPNIFIKALGYVGLCCAILLIILPFFMLKKLKDQGHIFKIKYIDNNFFLYLSLILGIMIIFFQIISI